MKTVTLKEYSTRIKGDPFTFRLVVTSDGDVKLAIDNHKGPIKFDEMLRDDVVSEHLRATAADFLTGKTV
jgi:hypothetical protein